ncbi:MAG: DUF3718 domain-containing protein [Colwellia sp.]|nr:DUF3718 domain-containing protein [Colwellia sp.]
MNVKKLSIAVLMTTGLIASAQAADIKSANNSLSTKLCVAAAAGNRAAMHNEIKASGYSSNFVAKNVQCNGENIISFIEHNGKNADAMINKLDRTATNVTITDLAENRIKENVNAG